VHALNLILSGAYEEGLEWARKTLQIPNANGYWPHAVTASALANLDRPDEARAELAQAMAAKPDLSISFLKTNLPTRQSGGLDPYLNGLRQAGLKDS
jgi:hypothetical protein